MKCQKRTILFKVKVNSPIAQKMNQNIKLRSPKEELQLQKNVILLMKTVKESKRIFNQKRIGTKKEKLLILKDKQKKERIMVQSKNLAITIKILKKIKKPFNLLKVKVIVVNYWILMKIMSLLKLILNNL